MKDVGLKLLKPIELVGNNFSTNPETFYPMNWTVSALSPATLNLRTYSTKLKENKMGSHLSMWTMHLTLHLKSMWSNVKSVIWWMWLKNPTKWRIINKRNNKISRIMVKDKEIIKDMKKRKEIMAKFFRFHPGWIQFLRSSINFMEWLDPAEKQVY